MAMTAVLLSADLIAISQVQGAVAGAMTVRAAANEAQALEAVGDQQVGVVVVDLGGAIADLAQFARALRAASPRALRLIAFGPHVHVDKLSAARNAGFDVVVSRGQFLSQAKQILDGGTGIAE